MSRIDEIFIKMRNHKITQKAIAAKSGYTKDWISMLLTGKAESSTALDKIETAINELIAEKEC